MKQVVLLLFACGVLPAATITYEDWGTVSISHSFITPEESLGNHVWSDTNSVLFTGEGPGVIEYSYRVDGYAMRNIVFDPSTGTGIAGPGELTPSTVVAGVYLEPNTTGTIAFTRGQAFDVISSVLVRRGFYDYNLDLFVPPSPGPLSEAGPVVNNPEPATIILCGLGIAVLAWRRRGVS